jgi:VWFA-related protein
MALWRLAARTGFKVVATAAVVVGFEAQGQVSEPGSQGATIKSEVRIVLVDVVVTSGNGRPVGGLRKEDFQVAEDGRPQTISFFEEHKGAAPTTISLPPMPANVFTNYPTVKSTDSVNVLLLDSLNTQALDQAYVRAQMTKYLQAAVSGPTGARLAIFTLASRLRMIRGFTADPSGLLMALSEPKSGTDPKVMREMATPSQKATDTLMIDSQRSPEGRAAIKQFLDDEASGQAADRTWMTLQAFQQLARYLSPIPGRKNVMWVSGSFPISFFPASDPRAANPGKYQSDIQQTAELLTADQVAVYPILATGLSTNSVYDSPDFGRPIEADDSDRAFNQIAMETLARDTGGKAFYNSNALNDAMAQAVDDGSHYYTLTYAPTNAKLDGKYRHIELKTPSGPYKLAYRRGYFAENAKFASVGDDKKKSDALAPLMAFGMPDFEQILYKVRLAQAKSVRDASAARSNTELKGPLVRYSLDFAISAQDLKLENSADGVRRGNIEVMLVAYDQDGVLLNSFRKKSEILLEPKAYLEVMHVGLQMHREIDVPEGEVLLRTGIYDLNSGKAGTLGTWVDGKKLSSDGTCPVMPD